MTTVLFPLSFPLEQNTIYWYFYFPATNFDQLIVPNLIRKYHLCVQTEIQISSNERLILDIKVHKKIGEHYQPVQYRIVYTDSLDHTVIRADGDHPYPHIDIELPNKEKV